jgi:hypothetical protein
MRQWHDARMAWHEENAVRGRSALGTYVDIFHTVHEARMLQAEGGGVAGELACSAEACGVSRCALRHLFAVQ